MTAAAPFTSARVGLIHGNQNWITVLQAITPEFLVVGEWDIAAGREIAPGELETGAKVILVGGTVADRSSARQIRRARGPREQRALPRHRGAGA